MKKTLVALAAVAATGGAMAQAVMTGYIGFGYASDTSSTGTVASGMGTDDGEINFAISEKIDGVGDLSGQMGFATYGNGDGAYGNDVKLALKMNSGTSITVGTTKGASYLTQGVASVGTAFNTNLSGKLFSSRSKNDSVSIAIPLAEGISLSLAHSEAAVTSYAIGSGAAGVSTQRYNTLGLGYKAGALVVDAGYRTYDNTTNASETSSNTRNRASASYDLGVAKIGFGFESTQYMYGNSKTDSLLGVNVPVSGALSLGVQFAQVSTTGSATAASNYSRSGSLLGANYNLSKQTYIAAQYYSYDAGTTTNPNGYQVLIYKGF